jgi:hypothetical protein
MKLRSPTIPAGARGFSRVEIVVLVPLLIAILFLIVGYSGSHRRKQKQVHCVNNLKNIGLAFRIWNTSCSDDFPFNVAVESGGSEEYTNLWQHFQTLTNNLSSPAVFVCPADKKATAKTWQSQRDQNISYFLGLGAAATYPQSFLSGDSGFEISGSPPTVNPFPLTAKTDIAYPKNVHRFTGNICMGDGSVQQLSNSRLKDATRNFGIETNLLLLPRK